VVVFVVSLIISPHFQGSVIRLSRVEALIEEDAVLPQVLDDRRGDHLEGPVDARSIRALDVERLEDVCDVLRRRFREATLDHRDVGGRYADLFGQSAQAKARLRAQVAQTKGASHAAAWAAAVNAVDHVAALSASARAV